MATIENYMSFIIESTGGLSDTQKQVLIREFQRTPEAAEDLLSGRIRPHITDIGGFGRVVIKHYFRGGILRHVNRRTYLKIGETRSRAEFERLALVRSFGVNAPMPVASASRTMACIFYHAWLATKEIPGARTLADIARSAPERALSAIPTVACQMNKLIEHHVLHVDLHPGNVLIDNGDRVFLIDFDRARLQVKNKAGIGRYYIERWRRAVIKHRLPLFLHEQIKKAVQHE